MSDRASSNAGSEFGAALASLGVTAGALSATQRQALDERGYLVLPDAVGADELDRLRAVFDRACEIEGVADGGTRHPARLLEFDRGFLGFLTHPPLLAAIEHLLGWPFRAGFAGRDPLPGHGQQGLHSDWAGPLFPLPCVAATALGMIDEFTEDNGATRIVPGTHRARRPPPKNFTDPASRHPDQTVITAPAGSVLVFSAYLWHGGTRNRSGRHRRSVQCTFRAGAGAEIASAALPLDLPPAVRMLFGDAEDTRDR